MRLAPPFACPACRAALEPSGHQVVCAGCRRAFPLADGVPDLLLREQLAPDEARAIEEWESGADDYLAWLAGLGAARCRPIDRPLLALAVGDVLEVGCGDGRLLAQVGGSAVRARLGIDPSRPLAAAARRRGLDVAVARGEQLPLPDGSVDSAISGYYALRYAELDRALGEIARVLRPGGRFGFTLLGRNAVALASRMQKEGPREMLRPTDVAGEDALRRRLERAGLRLEGLLGTPFVPRVTGWLGRATGGRLPYLRGEAAARLGFDVVVLGRRA